MKLFIANTTKQTQEFMYRLPGDQKIYMDTIPIGGQARIYKDTDTKTLEYIIKQHQDCPKPFLISADEMSRHRGHIGLIYSFDTEINVRQIERKLRENDAELIEQGKQIRKDSAAAFSKKLNDLAKEQNPNAEVGEVRTEIVEEVRTGDDEEGKIAEGVIVSAEPERRGRGRPRKN